MAKFRGREEKALTEYEKYNKQQHIESDFDREIKRRLKPNKDNI